jgi:chromosome segregation ATPase
METIEIRPQGELPTTIQIRNSPRLEKLAQDVAQHNRSIRDHEAQIHSLTVESQRLDHGGTFSVEISQRKAAIKQKLQAAERQLREHSSHRDRISDERRQWVEQIAVREYQRRTLWQELPLARPGPVSDWSMMRMYNLGEREQRTTGDVKRDLIDTLGWLINFSGPDAELVQELQQLRQVEEAT